jgi:hypothetical protein
MSSVHPAHTPPSGAMAPVHPAHTPQPRMHTPLPVPPPGTSQEGMPALGADGSYPGYGAELSSASMSMSAAPKKGSKLGLIAAIFTVLVVGGGIAGFVLLGSGDDKDRHAGGPGIETGSTAGATGSSDDQATNDQTGGHTAGQVSGQNGTTVAGTTPDPTGDSAGDDKTGDDKTGDDKTGDDKTGDDKTGDNTTVITPTVEPVTVLVSSSPARARVFRGDEDLGKTPLNVKVVPGQPMELVLKKRRYRDKKVTLDGSSENERVKLSRRPRKGSGDKGDKGDDKVGDLGLGLED